MDSMDNFRERFEALEQWTAQLQQHTRLVERRLRWWRGIACGLLLLGLVSLPLPSGTARDEQPTAAEYKGLRQRLAALEYKLEYVSGGPNEVVITGANLRIVNGLGATDTTNGLGNLIVGYNEPRDPLFGETIRTGSHNVVVGQEHNFSRFASLVVGLRNDISGAWSSAIGGQFNIASTDMAVVSGGINNTASGAAATVSGGESNTASGFFAVVSGGLNNTASSTSATVSGGTGNTAKSNFAVVSGGTNNTASGIGATISGGNGITQAQDDGWSAGSFGGTISGRFVSP
jgi:hypothetical protein